MQPKYTTSQREIFTKTLKQECKIIVENFRQDQPSVDRLALHFHRMAEPLHHMLYLHPHYRFFDCHLQSAICLIRTFPLLIHEASDGLEKFAQKPKNSLIEALIERYRQPVSSIGLLLRLLEQYIIHPKSIRLIEDIERVDVLMTLFCVLKSDQFFSLSEIKWTFQDAALIAAFKDNIHRVLLNREIIGDKQKEALEWMDTVSLEKPTEDMLQQLLEAINQFIGPKIEE